jgi:uncharacterized protein
MTEHQYDFDEFSNLLLPLGAINSPAELQGMLCGRLCGGQRLTIDVWLNTAWEFLDLAGSPQGELSSALTELYQSSLQALRDDNFSLSLLLPDDDTDLDQRSLALGQWCHGFLSGFGSSGMAGDAKLSAETSEALRDFAAIVQIGVDDEADEEAETGYVELVEYVRMAALSLFLEFGADNETDTDKGIVVRRDSSTDSSRLH